MRVNLFDIFSVGIIFPEHCRPQYNLMRKCFLKDIFNKHDLIAVSLNKYFKCYLKMSPSVCDSKENKLPLLNIQIRSNRHTQTFVYSLCLCVCLMHVMYNKAQRSGHMHNFASKL